MQQRTMRLSEVDEINRATDCDREIFDQIDPGLRGEGCGSCDCEIKIALHSVMAGCERTKEECHSYRGIVSEDIYQLSF